MKHEVYTVSKVRYVEVADPTQEEIDAESTRVLNQMAIDNRTKRDQLLIETDWTQGSDSPLTDEKKTHFASYRTELRDITDHENWPELEDTDWPVKPT